MKNDIRIIDSSYIFKGFNIVEIRHNGSIYILRITKDNKLILTK
ncbi:hemin uptake protein HemP [Aliarcobacter butzleri]|nr:hemin uptake protein HemP [Aliarcobacter butzleri]MCT7587330.1 hemin uptake protein HemP [Aliarcobacter butzleri]